MRADPEPLEAVVAFDGQKAVFVADARQPDIVTQPIEMEVRVIGSAFQQCEVLVGCGATVDWQRIK